MKRFLALSVLAGAILVGCGKREEAPAPASDIGIDLEQIQQQQAPATQPVQQEAPAPEEPAAEKPAEP